MKRVYLIIMVIAMFFVWAELANGMSLHQRQWVQRSVQIQCEHAPEQYRELCETYALLSYLESNDK